MDKSDVIYRYDGSFDGFLCCVFESYVHKEIPVAIEPEENIQSLFYRERYISTDFSHAERVFLSLSKKISPQAELMVRQGFLSCEPKKELLLYRFIRLGYQYGGRVALRLTDETVNTLNRSLKYLHNEAHLFIEFLRFSDYDGALTAVIEPKNTVLPLVGPHFANRFPDETFLIFDKVHHMAYVHTSTEARLIPLEALELPSPDSKETSYRQLWKSFFETVAVEGRYNPRCQMTHMPKRYWKNMTEQQTLPELPQHHGKSASFSALESGLS